MPTYSYACAACGAFDVVAPMAEAGAQASCPVCDRPGRRVYGAPALRAVDQGLSRALDAQARSADEPRVVTSVPVTGRRRRTMRLATDPRQARLPRP